MNQTEETTPAQKTAEAQETAHELEQHEGAPQETDANIAPESAAETEISTLKSQLEDARNKYIYLLADFDNYKRNAIRERENLRQTAGADVITAMLAVLDDFDRALKDESVGEGIRLIHHKMLHILQTKGLASMEVKPGDTLDADRHEAIAGFPATEDDPKGKILEVVEQGYLLNGKIIRHAKVVVAQ